MLATQQGSPYCFNTQPPEGGWEYGIQRPIDQTVVSTHSRPKAAGMFIAPLPCDVAVSTHSRPKAAGPAIRTY